ncbi:M4 family metallopeptidase [Dyadobacter psychrotolerans]|uniref:Neutral metalloproteinase n=1 Tax=Dyadobacter psychrotolerans TaxID=2541721 RepID=A0A4R5DSD5_9BACT|nr:M4 family metallopeptidase [Dyadobacter psychrotolerans]TDE17342.1 M4 family peptidase [Dyadobacter psychrotolerans]
MCNNRRNPVNCILPPYILEKIDQTNNSDLGDQIVLTAQATARFRSKRASLNEMTKKGKAGFLRTVSGDTDLEGVLPKPKHLIYDAGGLPITPGELIWKDGDPAPKDKDAKNVLNGATQTWKFYYDLFKRNSIDGIGMPLTQCIHYREDPRKPFSNAIWDGEQMIYGDGDTIFFDSFTRDIDIIAHELTHGVIDYSAKLEYKFESGALNESFADVFGIMVKQRAKKESVKKSNWLIGQNILLGDEYALRSMKEPGSGYKNHPGIGDDPQVAVMSDYINMSQHQDNGGVHYNSGIPNFAFYVAAFNCGGNSWDKLGKVWYAAMTDKILMKKNSKFLDARNATLTKAELLFGKASQVYKAVGEGWDAAEVK